jgi:AcrR family transcriptional regulator
MQARAIHCRCRRLGRRVRGVEQQRPRDTCGDYFDRVPDPRQRRSTARVSPLHPAHADARVRQRRGQARRQQIIEAAIELFSVRGYRGTDIADVAEQVGMTATGLMYYFGSKERLLQEAVAEHERAEAIEGYDELTLADLRDIGRHGGRNPVLTRLYVMLGAESLDPAQPLNQLFISRYEQVRAAYQGILERDRQRGLIRDDIDLHQIATEILSMSMGTEIQWLADPNSVDVAAVLDAYISRLVRELAPRRRSSASRTRTAG